MGTAHPPGSLAPPDLDRYVDAPLPAVPLDAPQPGPFGTVEELATPAACAAYLDAVAEPVALYRDARLVHPGLLLRLVNAALIRNVALGAWIHTASDCRLLDVAHVGERLAVRSNVTKVFTRKSHDYVRYDAVVLTDGRPVAEVRHEAIWRLGHVPTA